MLKKNAKDFKQDMKIMKLMKKTEARSLFDQQVQIAQD